MEYYINKQSGNIIGVEGERIVEFTKIVAGGAGLLGGAVCKKAETYLGIKSAEGEAGGRFPSGIYPETLR